MESFKTLVASLLSPLVIALALQLTGWAFWTRSPRRGQLLLALGTAILLLGSLAGLTYQTRRAAEFQYSPLSVDSLPDGPLQIVILGTGFNPDSQLPANSRVGGAFLSRLLEGIRIVRARPDSLLIVSIAGETPTQAKEQFWAEMKPLLGIDSTETLLLTTAQSTLDEAQLVQPLNNGQPLVLATSAGHMPRAVRIFAAEGLQVLPAPTDYGFVRAGSSKDRIWPRWIPSTDGLGSNHAFLYEAVAGAWQWVRTSKQP
jgi:uncharacterized SAM-binding protein YcdF (DUF218 family)